MKLLGLFAGTALLAMSVTAQAEDKGTESAQAQQAAGMEAMMMQMMKQQMAKACEDKEMLSCMEVTQAECNEMMDGILNKCMAPNFSQLMAAQGMSEEERDALNTEMENCANGISEKHGIDPEKAKSCSPNQQ
ncbi:hypothetical protein [Kangiella geojedonensis]|uniref:Uncharacterized protein n=1 Tax=Kangiella geojedonensis TaxID=914150 RepID=A0A0F6TR69_9GAMM|nr:hypothetical protein [Kangiella geojedonensis]AKE52440.1 hypothetical protein TQ33_1493 [Kangiella geojedonensis]